MTEHLQEIAPGAYISHERPVVVSGDLIAWLKTQAKSSPKLRARLCAHVAPDSAIHEMIIVLQQEGYIRPHRHLNKSESMHVIEGRAALIYFNEEGNPLSVRFLGLAGKGDYLFCRTEGAVYHTVQVLTQTFVFHETTQGPFHASDTEFAPWAPAEKDFDGIPGFTQRVNDIVVAASQKGSSLAKASI